MRFTFATLLIWLSFTVVDAKVISFSVTDKIFDYASGISKQTPTLSDYKEANISEVTADNIKEINAKIKDVYVNHEQHIYWYDTNQSYTYSFDSSKAKKINVPLKDGVIHLPETINTNETILLKLSIKSTKLGKLFQPYIVVENKKLKQKHYFETDVKGFRYLNLTSISHPDIALKLHAIRAVLPDQNCTVVVYPDIPLRDKTILILAPHPDDAEIAAYGLYSTNASHVYIATLTAGEEGGYNYDELFPNKKEHSKMKGKLRVFDSLTVPLLGGVSPLHLVNLGFFDGTLQWMAMHQHETAKSKYLQTDNIHTFRKFNKSPLANNLSGKSDWKSLYDNMLYLINKIQPDVIISPYPALDRHSDHKYTSIVMFEALAASHLKKGKLLLYTNHHIMSESYPFGLYGDPVDLPPYFDKPFYFESIFAFKLSPDKQKEKIFALEAMHDLRMDTEWYFSQRKFHKKVDDGSYKTWMWHGQDVSYFRRAIRSEELFYVLDIAKMIQRRNIYKNPIVSRVINGH